MTTIPSTPPTANPVYWDDYGPTLIGLFTAANALTLLTTGSRLYVRVVILRTPGPDDYSLVAAQALSMASFILTIVQYATGTPEFDYDIYRRNQWITALEWNMWDFLLAIWTMALIKISVGFFLLRFAQTPAQRWLPYGGMIVVTICCLEWSLATIFGCWPVNSAWNDDVPGNCISRETAGGIYAFNSIMVLVTDYFFCILPIFVIRRLNFNRRTKLTLYAVIGLGLTASCFSIAKLIVSVVAFEKPAELKYYFDSVILWSAEMTAASLAASLPILRPLFVKWFGWLGKHAGQHGEIRESTSVKRASIASIPGLRSLLAKFRHGHPVEIIGDGQPSPPGRVSVDAMRDVHGRPASTSPRVRNWFSINDSKGASNAQSAMHKSQVENVHATRISSHGSPLDGSYTNREKETDDDLIIRQLSPDSEDDGFEKPSNGFKEQESDTRNQKSTVTDVELQLHALSSDETIAPVSDLEKQ